LSIEIGAAAAAVRPGSGGRPPEHGAPWRLPGVPPAAGSGSGPPGTWPSRSAGGSEARCHRPGMAGSLSRLRWLVGRPRLGERRGIPQAARSGGCSTRHGPSAPPRPIGSSFPARRVSGPFSRPFSRGDSPGHGLV